MSILSRDQKLWTDLRKLRSRSRELADNDPTAAKFLALCEVNVIGKHGMKLQPKVKNLRGDGLADALNKQIIDEWRLWCKRGVCTMDGTVAFDELERLLIRTAAMDGEFIALKKVTQADPWGFALQQVDMDQLDHTFFLEKTSTGTEIRMGVEVDQYRRPVAYWLWTRHQNEWSSTYLARKRIPAESVIHAFDPDSANQTRGVLWMAPAMFQMNMLRGYMEAEVTAARVGACQMGIIEPNGGPESYTGDGRNADSTITMQAQPGGFLQLNSGTFKEFKPDHPNTAFGNFVKEVKRGIAASLSVSYTSLAEDLESVNFSSIRAGLLNERDMWRVRQKRMIESFHKPIFRAWLECAMLSGRIDIGMRSLDEVAEQCKWHPRGWQWVDPFKDMQASALGVQNSFTTRSRILGEQGYDFEETLEELAAEEKLIQKYGLKIGTDAKGLADASEDAKEGDSQQSKGGSGATYDGYHKQGMIKSISKRIQDSRAFMDIGANPSKEELLELLKEVAKWNSWRVKYPGRRPNLQQANFRNADLRDADLREADLRLAILDNANLMDANLAEADLRFAHLTGSNLRRANLAEVNFTCAELQEADFESALLAQTIFGETDLSGVKNLETCDFAGPSTIDFPTLRRSGPLPLAFLRGCGLPDAIIDYLPSLLSRGVEFYSCFISYSTKDQEFADRLYADLQNKGIRCWFAPHDLRSGKKVHEQIDQAIRMYDRLLLILSPHSMESGWVETEIYNARKREGSNKPRVLFPISLVPFDPFIKNWTCFDADNGKDSAREIREYYIPDFSTWKDHDSYQKEFAALVKSLKKD